MVGSCNCLITGVRLQPNVRLQLCKLICNEQNTAVYAPIACKEIIIVVINDKTKYSFPSPPLPPFINNDWCLSRNDFMTQLQQKDSMLLQ